MRSRKLIFVCTGNQCRSPMAEYLMKLRLESGSSWEVGSAGTATGGGSPASAGAYAAMQELGADLSGHRSSRLTAELINSSDVIVAMTRGHMAEVLRRVPDAAEKTFLLKSFGSRGPAGDVSDPVGMPVSYYREIRDEIASHLPDLADFMGQIEE